MSVAWTPARRDALRAFARNGVAWESNGTDAADSRVHWQPLRWLVEKGYAQHVCPGSSHYELTPAGVAELDRFMSVEQLKFSS